MVSVLLVAGAAGAQAPPGLGTEEFGLNQRELVQAIERVEELISKCMRERGFQYVAADHNTVRAGMAADKKLPGLSEEEFISKYGFGLATLYTGQPPQLATGYSPAKVGLGEQNVQYYKSLSAGDQAAYSFALSGENNGATFAIALETEDLSATGVHAHRSGTGFAGQLKTNSAIQGCLMIKDRGERPHSRFTLAR
jgi:hypothetical protein